MTDTHADLDAALERVIEAARTHLAAVKVANGRNDDGVWRAYVDLNNASYDYDELLLDAYDEVTPWDVQVLDPEQADERFGVGLGGVDGIEPTDPHPHVISVRQRRDYRVPSVAALLRVAEAARRNNAAEDNEPVETPGEAVLDLLQCDDGSLTCLDIPELEPLDGMITVSEVAAALDLDAFDEDNGNGPFRIGPEDRVVGRLDEPRYVALDDDADYNDTADEDAADDDAADEDAEEDGGRAGRV